ncbi:MAG: ferritin-like domain-containing protein [Alphaproteobacteria bacterium]
MTTGMLCDAAIEVLSTADPVAKAETSRRFAELWNTGSLTEPGDRLPPDRPARPERPILLSPGQMPKRRIGAGPEGRIALLHALAHIELNAIDLAWDILARFTSHRPALPREFYDDWVAVADDESRHFLLLQERLKDLGAGYGDLPAHDGLWQAAQSTAHDLQARLAVVPMVLEARGLDVTPAMIDRLKKVGDPKSADILSTIHDDEIRHVAAGTRWFQWICDGAGENAAETWQRLVATYFKGQIKPPFNKASRRKANFPDAFYDPDESA